jgi:hypothetical protein
MGKRGELQSFNYGASIAGKNYPGAVEDHDGT